jgi:hypothetical protein
MTEGSTQYKAALDRVKAMVRKRFSDIELSRRNCQHLNVEEIIDPDAEYGDTAIDGSRMAICTNRHCGQIVEVIA